jgi:hypothetical protein
MIDLSTNPTGTKHCEVKTKTMPLPQTIKRRHSFNSMMKFLSNREALFMIPELPSVEDHYTYSSSFSASTSPTKPINRKTDKKSTVHTSFVNALSIVDSRQNLFLDVSNNKCPLHCEQDSVATASTVDTAELTDEENDISSKGDEKRESKEEEREAAALVLPKAPLLRGSRRWGEQNTLTGGDEQHYLYVNVRRLRRDSPPVCPVRRYE